MKNGRMQAKDIRDVDFLLAVGRVQHEKWRKMGTRHIPWANWGYDLPADATAEDIARDREVYGPFVRDAFPGVPEKVLRAKGQRLIDRDLMTGCMCGCRGDMELTRDGLEFLMRHGHGHGPALLPDGLRQIADLAKTHNITVTSIEAGFA